MYVLHVISIGRVSAQITGVKMYCVLSERLSAAGKAVVCGGGGIFN